jgi:hypothetical protein
MENVSPENQLLRKYDLHNQSEVKQAARRTLRMSQKIPDGRIPRDPAWLTQNYLDRLDHIFNPPPLEGHPDFDRQQRNIDLLKPVILDKFATKVEEIPESYWKSQERIIRERGQQGDYDRFSDEEKTKWKNELAQGLLEDQRASLEQWVDYLAHADPAVVPNSIKYWIFRSVTDLQEYDKDTQEFPKRSKGTVKMFPDLNQEALGYVVTAIAGKYKGEGVDFERFGYELPEEEKQKFRQSLGTENFAKLYAWANEYIQPVSQEEMTITDGSWVKYEQDSEGNDSDKLSRSLRGRGTGWCTAGDFTAKNQLKTGDFYVYYSNDANGNPINPRIAIRMEEGRIAEVRGVAAKQNLDPYMNDVLAAKLEEFPDKDQYLKTEADMKRLTGIDSKVKVGGELTAEELRFLYETDTKIDGFGYERDPRIKELRDGRDSSQDMLVIFDCQPSEIAHSAKQLNEHTKAYVGTLEPGIFDRIRKYGIEHVYTKFPEGRIRIQDLEIGGKDFNQLERELSESGMNVSQWAESMIRSRDFTTLSESQNLSTVRLKVSDLGFTGYPKTDQIYAKAKELGLELCPAEAGPHLRLKYKDQPMNEWLYIGMKPITDSNGSPDVFELGRPGGGLWLDNRWAGPGRTWDPKYEFVFSLRK